MSTEAKAVLEPVINAETGAIEVTRELTQEYANELIQHIEDEVREVFEPMAGVDFIKEHGKDNVINELYKVYNSEKVATESIPILLRGLPLKALKVLCEDVRYYQSFSKGVENLDNFITISEMFDGVDPEKDAITLSLEQVRKVSELWSKLTFKTLKEAKELKIIRENMKSVYASVWYLDVKVKMIAEAANMIEGKIKKYILELGLVDADAPIKKHEGEEEVVVTDAEQVV
ncbi:hypothetical protein BPT24_105 [Tenacibaculum phage pT24]|uniref:Uncharacterized protein n=1 Tax=Tenacibaculum phage pT24 TaxID=1880590 RepID=A0A1B4XWN9_9CAUD|nr:hypothetical protein HYP10_gp105 [Tenacibaculum phage pT24]BAV39230.1 hypothetical protein BPT24_105 [Tenacibaculum phage pT24]